MTAIAPNQTSCFHTGRLGNTDYPVMIDGELTLLKRPFVCPPAAHPAVMGSNPASAAQDPNQLADFFKTFGAVNVSRSTVDF